MAPLTEAPHASRSRPSNQPSDRDNLGQESNTALMEPSPHPLSQFVLKVHSRCDLACDHCYVFEHADQSWQGRPVVISGPVLDLTARRIAEHARTHRLDTVYVVLHGGEPLLAGRARLRPAVQSLRTALDVVCALDLRSQTKGVTLVG